MHAERRRLRGGEIGCLKFFSARRPVSPLICLCSIFSLAESLATGREVSDALTDKILLGFEVGSGKPVYFPLNHSLVTGMTQLSGKTTTLEALLTRSKLTALTFRTKRGELGFKGAHQTPLYFNEQGLLHWQALEGLLDSTLQEKVRREPGVRAALMNLSGGAKSMREIYQRNDAALAASRGFMHDVHTKLKGYFDLILPQLKALQPRLSDKLELQPGMNMMDLEGLNEEMQALLIAAATVEIHAHRTKTIIVIPEAWKFLPEGRGSPCKLAVLHFLKEGAIIGNYLWVDTQDLRSFDKQFTRSFDNWVLGRQRDKREIEEVMDAIPLPKRERPPPEEIKRLGIGFFLACLHDDVKRVYVQPSWLSEDEARKVALGEKAVAKGEPQAKPLPVAIAVRGDSPPASAAPAKLEVPGRDFTLETISIPLAIPQPPPIAQQHLQVPISQPNMRVSQALPELQVAEEPRSTLGRICVVLYNATVTKPKIWSDGQIKTALAEHAWPPDGYESARDILVRWEILIPIAQGGSPPRVGYKFAKDRVQLVPIKTTLEVA